MSRFRSAVPVFVISSALSVAAAAATIRLHFDSDLGGRPPGFLRFESSAGKLRQGWRAIPDKNAVTLEMVAVQTDRGGTAGQYRFALSTEAKAFLDGKAAVSVKRQGAGDLCRGGLAVRFRDPQNFFGVLWDAEKGSVSAFSMRKGVATILGSRTAESNEPLWRTVGVELAGRRVGVTVSGNTVLEVTDPDPAPGAAGLLAEGGSVVAFDELLIETK